MKNVVIACATRTAIGKFGGSLKDLNPAQLGSIVLKDALKLLHELKRRNGRYGLATLCIGGGQGIAIVVQR
ncbi:MAG: hypothetical protein OIN83_12515 [Candidatus Methanoperedens sp.]|nr:hypothetical protein [Candidatus Methanoperedens sp.]